MNMKIFIIGFNKCGTSSFHDFFQSNGLKSIHHHHKGLGNASKKMAQNAESGKQLLAGVLDAFQAYSDMTFLSDSEEIEGFKMYKELDFQYPSSLFILNTRNIDDWVLSRLRHKNKRGLSLAKRHMLLHQLENIEELIAHYKKDWEEHLQKVRKYFKGRNNFIEFNIQRDSPDQIVCFMQRHGFNIVCKEFPKKNRS